MATSSSLLSAPGSGPGPRPDSAMNAAADIVLRGVREAQLAGADVRLPAGRLVTLTGPAGFGVEAVAHRILIGESRRRYLLALSPYERVSLGGVGAVARVDDVSGLPPAQALPGPMPADQTVADRLQLAGDLARLVQARARVQCTACGGDAGAFHEEGVAAELERRYPGESCLIVAPMALGPSSSVRGVLEELARAGFRRLRVGSGVVRFDDDAAPPPAPDGVLQVVVDRLAPGRRAASRVGEAVRSARAIARGRTLLVGEVSGEETWVSPRLTCTRCGTPCAEPDWQQLVRGEAARGAAAVLLGDQPLAEVCAGLTPAGLEQLAGDGAGPEDAATGGATAAARRLRRATEIAAQLDLAGIPLRRRVSDLAHGEQLLVAIAAARITGLSGVLYVVDSPPSALEDAARASAVRGLRALVDAGSCVVVLDGADSASTWADEVVALAPPSPTSATAAPRRPPREPQELLAVTVDAAPEGADAEALPPGPRLSFPQGRLTVLHGPTGAGKSALLRLLRGRLSSGRSGPRGARAVRAPGVRRCVDLTADVDRAEEGLTLCDLVGLSRPLARVFAAGPAARELGLPAEAFQLDRPGGRCTTCEGRGVVHHRLDLVEDVAVVCPRCDGRRFRDEVLQVTGRGLTIAEVLESTLAQVAVHFARERSLHEALAAAGRCGLGARPLGTPDADLERSERLLARLARHGIAAGDGDLFVLDRPAAGAPAREAGLIAAAATELAARGATVVAADASPAFAAVADSVIELPPRRRTDLA